MASAISQFKVPTGAWIEVSGEDAGDFLQGQFTNDLRAGPGQATFGLWLDHRGRIQADSTVLQIEPERYMLHSWGSDASDICRRLEAHIVADDVELRDLTEEVCAAVLSRGRAELLLTRCGGSLPEPGKWAKAGEAWIFPFQGGSASSLSDRWWLMVGNSDAIASACVDPDIRAAHTAPEAWHAERIRAHVPLIPAEVGMQDTPAEAGLEQFCPPDKGCFLGQEVVARQRRLGRRTRELRGVSLSGTVGTLKLPLALRDGDEQVGELRAVASTGGQWVGLAMLKARFIRSGKRIMSIPHAETEVVLE